MKTMIQMLLILTFAVSASAQFPRDQKIVSAEYFIDVDPGLGMGTSIDIGNMPLWEVDVNIDDIPLPAGSTLYIRFKSTNGTWSAPRGITHQGYFTERDATIVYAEYFINDDPGQGHGNEFILENGISHINGLELKRGDRVFFRLLDSYNRWSPARSVQFNFKHIDYAEYYVRYTSGDSTLPAQLLSLSPYNPFTCVYTVDETVPVAGEVGDVLVRYHAGDKFNSGWVKWSNHTGTDDLSTSQDLVRCYPNPCRDYITLEFSRPVEGEVTVDIFGIAGNLLKSFGSGITTNHDNKLIVDTSGLPAGIYLFSVRTSAFYTSCRIIVQR